MDGQEEYRKSNSGFCYASWNSSRVACKLQIMPCFSIAHTHQLKQAKVFIGLVVAATSFKVAEAGFSLRATG